MVVFRVTAKVAARLKKPLDTVVPSPSQNSIFGDWYVNLLFVNRHHLLLLVSEKTLLPVLMSAKEMASFPTRFPVALNELLLAFKIPSSKIEVELKRLEQWRFAKTASRQVLGTMNDFSNLLAAYLEDGAPLVRQSLRLGFVPSGPIEMKMPLEKAAAAFGENLALNPFEIFRSYTE